MEVTRCEALKEMRSTARKAGLTFKTQNARIGGKQAYKFVDRETGAVKLSGCTFWGAYENCVGGYIESYSSKSGSFEPSEYYAK